MRLIQTEHTRLVAVITDVIPVGVPYRITGAADGLSWTVAEGVGSGATVAVSDPATPFDVETTYTVSAGTIQTAQVTRVLEAHVTTDTLVISEDGRVAIQVAWTGEAGSSWASGVQFVQPLARRYAVPVVPLTPGAPSWAFEALVDSAMVATARRVFEAGLMWVVHSHAACSPHCTLPRTMLAGVDGSVTESSWAEGRTFAIALRQVEPGLTGVPVVTFGEAATVWGPGTTFESIRQAIGGS